MKEANCASVPYHRASRRRRHGRLRRGSSSTRSCTSRRSLRAHSDAIWGVCREIHDHELQVREQKLERSGPGGLACAVLDVDIAYRVLSNPGTGS
jgi:hypothetical protein